MRTTPIFLSLMLMLGSSAVYAGDSGCRQHKEFAGECFTVHGRLKIYNGTPACRIWIIGTKRILGIACDEQVDLPPDIYSFIVGDAAIYGDFRVCPLTPEHKGWMRDVCVESATHIHRVK